MSESEVRQLRALVNQLTSHVRNLQERIDHLEVLDSTRIRKTRAFMHYVNSHATQDLAGWSIHKLACKFPGIENYITYGDLVSNVAISGYRAQGVWIFNGFELEELDTDFGYPSIPSRYNIISDFPQDYWNDVTLDEEHIMIYQDDDSYTINDFQAIYSDEAWETFNSDFYWHVSEPYIEHIDMRSVGIYNTYQELKEGTREHPTLYMNCVGSPISVLYIEFTYDQCTYAIVLEAECGLVDGDPQWEEKCVLTVGKIDDPRYTSANPDMNFDRYTAVFSTALS